jgi:hypothetical protein
MFEQEGVTVRRPRAWLVHAMTSLFVTGILAVALGVVWWPAWVFPGMLAMLFAASTLGYVPRIGVGATCRVGRLTAGQSGLFLDGATLMERESIAAGYSPAPGSRTVHVIGRGFFERLELRLPNGADARALVDALALEPSQRTALFRVEGMWGRLLRENLWFLGQVACFNVTRLSGQALALIASMASFLYAMLLIPRRLVVGHDGISIAYLGAERFLPYGNITSVQRLGTQVVIDTDEGKLRFQIYGTMREVDDAEALASMMERARERAARARAAAEGMLAEMFGRGARTNEAWVADLKRLMQRTRGTYRDAAFEPERLWKLVEEAVSDETARAGAAWTLAAHPLLDKSMLLERFARLAERSASSLMCEVAEAASLRDARRLGEILLRWPDAHGFPMQPPPASTSMPRLRVVEFESAPSASPDLDEEEEDVLEDEPPRRRRPVSRASY